MYNCLDSIISNKITLKEIVINSDDIMNNHKDVKLNILDDSFWGDIEYLEDLLSPLNTYITRVQTTKPIISYVVEVFYNLDRQYTAVEPGSCKKFLLSKVKQRKEMVIRPIHCAANFLVPYLKGKHLTSEEYIKTLEYISKAGS